jgi:nicotinamide-nucleotide amidase
MAELDALTESLGRAMQDSGRKLAVAESLTGGLLCNAMAKAEGASDWFAGGVVAYRAEAKRAVLDVPAGEVVSESAAAAMARGAARVLDASISVAVTGAGGPDPQDGEPPGTVWLATSLDGRIETALRRYGGDPEQICKATCIDAVALILGRLAEDAPAEVEDQAQP